MAITDADRAANDERVADDVRRHGCHVISVFDPQEQLPTLSCSIGIFETSGAPEASVMGLRPSLGHSSVNECQGRCRAGERFERGRRHHGFLEEFPVYIEPLRPKRAAATTPLVVLLLLAAATAPCRAGSWRAEPFAEATLTLRAGPLGELRFAAAVTQDRPTRLARVTLALDGESITVPPAAYRDVVNPRLQETLALVPFDCERGGCDGTAAVLIRYYPALGDPRLPRTAACASSYLRIVFDRRHVRQASVVECMNSRHQRERVVYRDAT